MHDSPLGADSLARGPAHAPSASDVAQRSIERLERERAELLEWVFHLERLGQAGLMASGLVHDAQNMLTAISGTCQLALLSKDVPAYVAGLDKAHGLAMRSAETMEVFLTFAKRSGPAGSECGVADVVADALRFLAPALPPSRVVVTRSVDPGLAVRGERTLLLQALVNLLLHAVRALASSPGRIEVKARRAGEEAVLEVAGDDAGTPELARGESPKPLRVAPGLPPADASAGTGLGLSVTRKIAEELGGRVACLRRPGLGATYSLRLPAAPRASAWRAVVAETPP